jgi:hypothetical protein
MGSVIHNMTTRTTTLVVPNGILGGYGKEVHDPKPPLRRPGESGKCVLINVWVDPNVLSPRDDASDHVSVGRRRLERVCHCGN